MPTPDQSHNNRALQQARDLAWCLGGADLLKPEYLQSIAAADYHSTNLTSDIEISGAPLLQPKKRLGLYFEQLWQLLVHRQLDQVIIAANQQIIHSGVTLGALDLLSFCNRQQTYFHYELAVKFYLEAKSGSGLTAWIGPNSRDRLDLKLDRLLNHQLPLAYDPRAKVQIKQWIANKGMPSIEATGLKQRLVMRGWLFQHYQHSTRLEDSVFVNPHCATGRWLHFKEISLWLEQSKAQGKYWLVLPRLYWLSPACIHKCSVKRLSNAELIMQRQPYLETPILLTTYELNSLVQAQGDTPDAQALLVAEVELIEDYWTEQRRIMWVNNYWPESTTRSARPSLNK